MAEKSFNCFRADGEWLKGNLHSHTTNSDGQATPQELVDWYEKHGYDFLAITDHDYITEIKNLQTNRILLIQGAEFGYKPAEVPGWTLDMLGINISELPSFLDPQKTGHAAYDPSISPQQIIDDVNARGGMAIMCHPYFMINLMEPYLQYRNYIGMEAYNYYCQERCGRGHQEIYWDAMLYQGKKLWGFATDDSHPAEFGHAWIEVKAKERSVPAILEAIRQGQFYATSGIKIFDAAYENGVAKISFDRPCDVVVHPWAKGLIVRSYQNTCRLVDGERRFYAELPVFEGYPYMRIELTDAHGNKAYTNPLYFD